MGRAARTCSSRPTPSSSGSRSTRTAAAYVWEKAPSPSDSPLLSDLTLRERFHKIESARRKRNAVSSRTSSLVVLRRSTDRCRRSFIAAPTRFLGSASSARCSSSPALLGLFAAVNRSPWVTQARVAREQPVQFSHEHHVAGNGIDCRYCHTSVEDSSFAGIPPTKTCMNCHSQIFANSPFLEPVRDELPHRPVDRSGRASTTCPTSSTSTTAST